MTMPRKLIPPSVTSARLVTKTSVSDPKASIALLILLWYEHGKPAVLEYGLDEGKNKDYGGEGILDQRSVDDVAAYAARHSIDLSGENIHELIVNNSLFDNHAEALNAAFELVWHLASFSFASPGFNRSSERKGGIRRRKRIEYTSNIDLIDLLAESNEDGFAAVIISWLTGLNISTDTQLEDRLVKMLTIFAEVSYYRTASGEAGCVYATSGIYDAALETADAISLCEKGNSNGPTRILKAAIKDGLNCMLVDEGGNAKIGSSIEHDALAAFSQRAKKSIMLSRIEIDEKEYTYEDEMPAAPASNVDEPRNLIYFGAPGTGKSYRLDHKADECFEGANVRRVTFHPDYTYAQFVGCYKPYSDVNDEGEHEVYYKYTFGPFLETYVDALMHPDNNYLLVIEEINRANPAAVFGDIFQLLDRKDDGTSEYPVRVAQDMGEELYRQLDFTQYDESKYDGFSEGELKSERIETIALPGNMFIWATMNSADQGVFPMDTAFKRRWDFRYMGINEGAEVIQGYRVPVGRKNRYVSWDALRTGINKVLLANKVNEDKLLGPFFIAPSVLADEETFRRVFKNKVLLYLFEDAAKTKKGKVFSLGATATYSDICKDFDERGEAMFQGFEPLTSYEPEPEIDSNARGGADSDEE